MSILINFESVCLPLSSPALELFGDKVLSEGCPVPSSCSVHSTQVEPRGGKGRRSSAVGEGGSGPVCEGGCGAVCESGNRAVCESGSGSVCESGNRAVGEGGVGLFVRVEFGCC